MTDSTDTTINTAAHANAVASEEAAETASVRQDVAEKILFILDIYPFVSRAMLQVALSPALPPKLWGPILDALVSGGLIILEEHQKTSPNGRNQVKQVYHLPKYPYPPASVL